MFKRKSLANMISYQTKPFSSSTNFIKVIKIIHKHDREREFDGANIKQFQQSKAKALGRRKNPVKQVTRRVPLDSFINSCRGLKLMAELLPI